MEDAVRNSPLSYRGLREVWRMLSETRPCPTEARGSCKGCCQKLSPVLQRPEGAVKDVVKISHARPKVK